MNQQSLIILTLVFSFVFLLIQRADPTRRKAVQGFGWFVGLLTIVYIWWYGALWEAVLGLVLALLFNGLFWVLIGRYNPASSSDDIRVMGLDD